jgi:tRNA-2-methylthio-N6-dimethylallyladenosine synthase
MDSRLERLQALLGEQTATFARASLGRVVPVLFERAGRHAGQLIGRSPWLQAVHAPAPASLLGEIADVRLIAVGPNSLAGELVAPARDAAPKRVAAGGRR